MTVTVYTDADYKGKSAQLGVGRHKLSPDVNDSISSVTVPDGWQVTLYENADFTGAKAIFTADFAKLPDTLNDKASSIVIASEVDSDGKLFSENNAGDSWFYFED
ncbi:peptidase inhibitor family I36 protein [Streptomyces sp. S1]|uniref:peptidase inhibitor family I36 protein n=1 Tax=Streptomyces sp. S1 TaxID=718288 RepID=UPI003D703397